MPSSPSTLRRSRCEQQQHDSCAAPKCWLLTGRARHSPVQAEGETEEVFAKYCSERSDCGSCKQGGDLGLFGPGEMQKQFEDGVKGIAVGKMSGIVLSDSGHHLIFRTA